MQKGKLHQAVLGRMNARMMRTRMTLEIVSELYTSRMFESGNNLDVSIRSGSDEPESEPFRIGINGDLMGGMRAPIEVSQRRVEVACVNPSPVVTMAYRGRGFFKEKMQIRALAVLPSWDKIAFAVSRDSGINSISEIVENKIPVRVHTRSSGVHNTTHDTLTRILALYGMSFRKIKNWGGRVFETPWPSSAERRDAIKTGAVNAVFDEGIKTWLPTALENGYKVLPIDARVIRGMEKIGFRASVIPKKAFKGLDEEVKTVDFSGWPLITHRWMSSEMAYSFVAAMAARRKTIPVDDVKPLNMRKICRDTEDGPIDIPFHRGALRFYKEQGYL